MVAESIAQHDGQPLGDADPTPNNTATSPLPPTQQDHHIDYNQPPDLNVTTPTIHTVTIDATVLTPPDDNASAAFTPNTYLDDLALRHSRNAFPSNTEEEQMQAEEDRVLLGDFQRNSSPTEPVQTMRHQLQF